MLPSYFPWKEVAIDDILFCAFASLSDTVFNLFKPGFPPKATLKLPWFTPTGTSTFHLSIVDSLSLQARRSVLSAALAGLALLGGPETQGSDGLRLKR